VGGVRGFKVEHVEWSFANSNNEKLGRFEITSRGEGPLLNDKPKILELAMCSGLFCISLGKPCLVMRKRKKILKSYMTEITAPCAIAP